ncbi:MAG: hypothetical protein IJI41_09945 [Anaerolineaceae bacterium]|nr:hypothetical protein [Anaerolineaceae bacterium]
MNVSDYRILQVIYLTLDNTKIERLRMSPFQFRRLIIAALQNRQYSVNSMEESERLFTVDRMVILFFPYEIEKDETVRHYLIKILTDHKNDAFAAYSIRNGFCACVLRVERPDD